MFKDTVSLDATLQQFETALKIEYKEKDTEAIIKSAISSLELAYKVVFDKEIYSLQAENQLVGDSIALLINQIQEACKSLSLYTSVNMFNRSIGISLASVNYLGFAKNELMQGLRYLQDCDLYQQRAGIIGPITTALTNIDVNSIKRLCIILLVLERLGVSEGVAIVSQLLYLGGLVV